MRLDNSENLADQGVYPEWLVYTEATGVGQVNLMRNGQINEQDSQQNLGVIRLASKVELSWIKQKLKTINDCPSSEKLCGQHEDELPKKKSINSKNNDHDDFVKIG